MAEPVGVAAVGLGRWAQVLAGAYTRSREVRLVTCYSRSADKRERFSQKFGCAAAATLDAVLADDRVAGVIVTVPNDQHADVIERCAQAGKHLYVEKPIAVKMEDARRIDRAVRQAGIAFLCGHSARRLGGLRKIKAMIEQGDLGGVSMAEVSFSNERGLELRETDWRGDPAKAPGGPLIQLGVHQIDNLQFLLGPVKRVFSFGKPMFTKVRNPTVTQTIMELENGTHAYLAANWACPGVFSVNVYGTRANLFYELDFSAWSNSDTTDGASRLLRVDFSRMSDDPDDRMLRKEEVAFAHTDHLRDEIEEFSRAIRGEAVPEVDTATATRNLAVVLAAVRSLEEGRPVDVAEILNGGAQAREASA